MGRVRRGGSEDGWHRIAEELVLLESNGERLPGDVYLSDIRLKMGYGDGDEFMAVVKGSAGDVPVVAFVTAPHLDDLVHLVAAKAVNGTLKWREDKPYDKRG